MGQEVSSRNPGKPPSVPRRQQNGNYENPDITLFSQERPYRSNLEKFSFYEIATMKQSFLTLSSLTPLNNTIDKDTFLHYFPLDGILAERLFSVFDKDQNNVIDCEEFLGGLALCLRGSLEEKYKLIFDMFNLDGSDYVSPSELKVVLESSVLAASRILHSGGNEGCIEVNSHCIGELVDDIVKEAITGCSNRQDGKLSLNDFQEWIQRHPYILDSIFNHSCIKDKYNSKDVSEDSSQTDDFMKVPLLSNDKKYQSQRWVYGADQEEKMIVNAKLYNASYLWSPVFPSQSNLPSGRYQSTTCVYSGSLYVLAGRAMGSTRKDFWRFDLGLNTWFKVEPEGKSGPTSLQEHTAVVYRGLMFVFGGEFTSTNEIPLWIYHFGENRWTKFQGKKGPVNRRCHSAVVYQTCMYVFGGYIDLRGATNQMWIFRFDTKRWTELTYRPGSDDPGPLYAHSAIVHNNAMWIFGGLSNLQPKNELWRWDFGVESWVKIRSKSAPPAIHGHSAVKVGDGMLVFGGESDGVLMNTLWRFDFGTYAWHVIKPHGNISPPVRSYQSLAVLSSFSCSQTVRPSTAHSAPPPTPLSSTSTAENSVSQRQVPSSQIKSINNQIRAISVESMYSRNPRPNSASEEVRNITKNRPMSSSSLVAHWRQSLPAVNVDVSTSTISDDSVAFFVGSPALNQGNESSTCDSQTLILEDDVIPTREKQSNDHPKSKRWTLPGVIESPPKTRKDESGITFSAGCTGKSNGCHSNCIPCLGQKISVDNLPEVEAPSVLINPQAIYKPYGRNYTRDYTPTSSSSLKKLYGSGDLRYTSFEDNCEIIENLSLTTSDTSTVKIEPKSSTNNLKGMLYRTNTYQRLEAGSPLMELSKQEKSDNKQKKVKVIGYSGNTVQPIQRGKMEEMLSTPLSLVKEGICLFVIGGKGKESRDFQRKALDMWRCDISFGTPGQEQIKQIFVETQKGPQHVDARESHDNDLLVMDLK